MDQLFGRRAAALTKGDLKAWLADVDPSAKAVVAQQTRLFAGLRSLPLKSYTWELLGPGRDHLVPASVQTVVGTDVRAPGMRVVYQLLGYDPAPVSRRYVPILAFRAGHLWFEGDQTVRFEPDTPLEPWDRAAIAVRAGKHALVVVSVQDRSRLASLVARADAATEWVHAMWPNTGVGHPVLYAVRDQAVLTSYSAHESAVEDFDGVTVGAYDQAGSGSAVEGTRVLLNPKHVTPASRADLLNDLLRHEFTHVAHWNDVHEGTPTWAVEGIAEFTSFRGHPQDQRVSTYIGKAGRAGRLPASLPRSRDFYNDPHGVHYGLAWLTFEYMSEKYGDAKIRLLYGRLSVIAQPADSAAALKSENAAFVSVLKQSEASYVKKLNAWIGRVLSPVR